MSRTKNWNVPQHTCILSILSLDTQRRIPALQEPPSLQYGVEMGSGILQVLQQVCPSRSNEVERGVVTIGVFDYHGGALPC